MIPNKISMCGNFKNVIGYLFKDDEQGRGRVSFDETRHLVSQARHAAWECAETFRNQDRLKTAAGVRKGGKPVSKPCLHWKLSWESDEAPTLDGMRQAAHEFVEAMGYGEHEAVIVGHTDSGRSHVHLVINSINPLTGRVASHKDDQLRARDWAMSYELAHGGKLRHEKRCSPKAEGESRQRLPRNAYEAAKAAKDSVSVDAILAANDNSKAISRRELALKIRSGRWREAWEQCKPVASATFKLHWQERKWAQGYWTKPRTAWIDVAATRRNGSVYFKKQKIFIPSRWIGPSWTARIGWARKASARFEAMGLARPSRLKTILSPAYFAAQMGKLHKAEKIEANAARKVAARDLLSQWVDDGIKADIAAKQAKWEAERIAIQLKRQESAKRRKAIKPAAGVPVVTRSMQPTTAGPDGGTTEIDMAAVQRVLDMRTRFGAPGWHDHVTDADLNAWTLWRTKERERAIARESAAELDAILEAVRLNGPVPAGIIKTGFKRKE